MLTADDVSRLLGSMYARGGGRIRCTQCNQTIGAEARRVVLVTVAENPKNGGEIYYLALCGFKCAVEWAEAKENTENPKRLPRLSRARIDNDGIVHEVRDDEEIEL